MSPLVFHTGNGKWQRYPSWLGDGSFFLDSKGSHLNVANDVFNDLDSVTSFPADQTCSDAKQKMSFRGLGAYARVYALNKLHVRES